MTTVNLSNEAIDLCRDLIKSFPQFGTDEPIDGAHAVDQIGILVGKAQDLMDKIDKEEKEQKAVQRYMKAALAGYYDPDGDGGVDFDAPQYTIVSAGCDSGAYVSCWVWVGDQDVKNWRRDKEENRMTKDEEILAARTEARNKREGPRIGDYVLMPGEEEPRRFTHDWGDSIQTTHPKFRGDARFYLGSNGGMDFSGSLDHALPKTKLLQTNQTRNGSCWFFHENDVKAHNGVHFMIPCRVFKFIE